MQRFRERSTRNEQVSAKGHVGKSLRVICGLYYVLKDRIVSGRIVNCFLTYIPAELYLRWICQSEGAQRSHEAVDSLLERTQR